MRGFEGRKAAALGLLLVALCVPARAQQALADPLAESIREQVEQLRDAGPAGPQLQGVSLTEGVARFYERREFAAAWTDPARREALAAQLRALYDDGLNPKDYEAERVAQGPRSDELRVLAAYDLAATRSYLLALAHLFLGKVDPVSLDAQWSFDSRTMMPDEALRYLLDAVQSGDISSVFEAARPAHFAYGRMRAALIRLREIASHGGWPQIENGPTLAPGVSDARVKKLRRRLALTDYLDAADDNGSPLYDDKVEAAVRLFQTKQYLDADGAVGPGTRDALNISAHARIGQVKVNLERGRWLLHQLHNDFLLVDIAGFELTYYRNLQPVWVSRVQVGKPYRNTPVFRSATTYVTLNPTWTVPPTVFNEDMLPRLQTQGPDFLERSHIRVFDGAGQELDAHKVDWKRPGNVILRQDAGPDNSLGRAVIRFPNAYSVFLHDTPHREHFSEARRAYSSGCIRVEKIEELVRLVLGEQGMDSAAIDALLADPATQRIKLDKPLPVLIGYWTMDVPEDGRLAFKPDVYERDVPLLKALSQAPQDVLDLQSRAVLRPAEIPVNP